MTQPLLTPERADAILAPRERVEGAEIIANILGVSPDTVHRLARKPGVPIYKPAGRYIAFRSELLAWLKTKPVG